jgi:tRNA pseudouridine13 synthase
MDRFYSLGHSSIDFHFKQTARDFVVEEIPLYEFSGDGEHLVMFVRKKNISTMEMVGIFARYLGIKNRDIGYAGLKDKHAMTKQYISIHKQHEDALSRFEHEGIKILSSVYHNNKIRIGHLKGNRFYIRLKKVNPTSAIKIDEALKNIESFGMPNYFGYQRFGFDDKYEQSQAVAHNEEIIKDKKLQHMLVSIYQSYIFNQWLVKRVELSKEENLKKLLELDGDIYDYKDKTTITGIMPGSKIPRAKKEAGKLEEIFDDDIVQFKGYRRVAWIKPTNITNKFNSSNNSMLLEFQLPKSSYATVFVEHLANKNFGY